MEIDENSNDRNETNHFIRRFVRLFLPLLPLFSFLLTGCRCEKYSEDGTLLAYGSSDLSIGILDALTLRVRPLFLSLLSP